MSQQGCWWFSFTGMWCCVVGKMFQAFLNCFTLNIKLSYSFYVFGTTHSVTMSQPTGLQSHIDFLQQSRWKSKISVNNMLGQNMWLKSWDWIQFVKTFIKHFCTHKALSTHNNTRIFKKLPLFTSSSRRRGYNLLHPLLLPEHGNTPTFDYGLCP